MEKTDCFDGVKLADYDAAAAEGKIQIIPDECLDAFVDAVLALRPGNDVSKLKLVYTPSTAPAWSASKSCWQKWA